MYHLHRVGKQLVNPHGGRRTRPCKRCGSGRLYAEGERIDAVLTPKKRSEGLKVAKNAMEFLLFFRRMSPSDCQNPPAQTVFLFGVGGAERRGRRDNIVAGMKIVILRT